MTSEQLPRRFQPHEEKILHKLWIPLVCIEEEAKYPKAINKGGLPQGNVTKLWTLSVPPTQGKFDVEWPLLGDMFALFMLF